MSHPPDDHTLVYQIANGDQDALAALAQRYHQALGRYLMYLLGGSAVDIEDILQEVYLAVWRGASSYRGDAQVRTWLFHIAHNCALNARLSTARRPLGRAEPLDEVTATVPSPEDAITSAVDLAAALAALAHKHRVVVELVARQGFSIEEAAQILAIPSGTVRSRLTYARRALLQRLGKEPIHE